MTGVKRPGFRVDHLPPSSFEVKESVQLHLYTLCHPLSQRSFMACYRMKFTFTILHAMVTAVSAKPPSVAHLMLTGKTRHAYRILLEETLGEITWKTEEKMEKQYYSSFHISSFHYVML